MKNFIVIVFLIFLSCSRNNPGVQSVVSSTNLVKYAKGFSIVNHGCFTEVEVYNPWNNYKLLARYIVVDSIQNIDSLKGEILKVPVRKGVFLSSTYIGMLAMLKAGNVIKACSNANWIYDSFIYQKYTKGEITDLGNGLSVDAEAVIAQSPDMVMKYIYQTTDVSDEILYSSGIPVVYNIEFMEEHPLGRAEWIKLMGLLTGKSKMADSIFNQIEINYNENCLLAKTATTHPTVLVGNSYKGTWYAVGGKSFMSKLIQDAGGDYCWNSDSSTGGLPLSFESVLQKQKDDEYWLSANAKSLDEILNIEPRCNKFSAFQSGNVFHYNKRMNPEGGLDYYESGVIRPDLLLHDLLVILHPELFNKNEQCVYWQKLK
jgi:iron complex transport system substrate-binding protein